MRYTASANNFLWYFFLPFLVMFYINFIFWADHNYSKNSIQELISKKQQATNSFSSVDGIILGGSNAQFGINAKSLSTLTNLTWVNLAIPFEGFSDTNYANFISNSLNDAKRLDVSFVLYSSATPVSETEYSARKRTSTNLVGKKRISYKPQRALASYLKSALGYNKNREFPVANQYCDFDFSDFDCDTLSSTPLNSRNYLNEVDLRIWIADQLTRILELFPNAKIIITIPNGFYKNIKETNYNAIRNLKNVVEDILLKDQSIGKRSVYLFSQKPYPSSDLMCNDYWHPNEYGREWRTNEIFQFINNQLFNK